MTNSDIHCYSIENVRRQITAAPGAGPHLVRFYSVNGRPSREVTGEVTDYYYFPSGGTIRDAEMNIVLYEPRLDAHNVRSI